MPGTMAGMQPMPMHQQPQQAYKNDAFRQSDMGAHSRQFSSATTTVAKVCMRKHAMIPTGGGLQDSKSSPQSGSSDGSHLRSPNQGRQPLVQQRQQMPPKGQGETTYAQWFNKVGKQAGYWCLVYAGCHIVERTGARGVVGTTSFNDGRPANDGSYGTDDGTAVRTAGVHDGCVVSECYPHA
jgi:hypothetical protein